MTKFLDVMNFDIRFSNIHINSYFVFVSLGIVIGCLFLVFYRKDMRKYRNDLFYCFLYAFIGIIIGSKLLYIILVLKYLIADPSLWLHVLEGGLVFYGGVIGGMIGALIYIRTYNMPMLDFLDSAAMGIPIGHAIGRLGCLVGGCCYGKATDCALGIIYPESNLAAPSLIKVHPVQLYESIANLAIFLILLLVFSKHKRKGLISGVYFILYGIARFVLEFFRADFRGNIGILSTSQFISVFIIIIGIILVYGKYNDKLESIFSKKNKEKLNN